jgi:hypothetical protein
VGRRAARASRRGKWTFIAVSHRVDAFPRAPVPGQSRVTLQSGGYLVYFEGPGSGRHSGQSVARFTITRPGRYLFAATPATGPGPADVAVGQGLGDGLVAGVITWGTSAAGAPHRRALMTQHEGRATFSSRSVVVQPAAIRAAESLTSRRLL